MSGDRLRSVSGQKGVEEVRRWVERVGCEGSRWGGVGGEGGR